MYARMNATLEALKTRACDGTQLAKDKFEDYKSRMCELHTQATAKLQTQRQAVTDAVTGRRDASVLALKERGLQVMDSSKKRTAEAVDYARTTARGVAEHPRESALAAVNKVRGVATRVTGVEVPTVEQAAASCSTATVAVTATVWRKVVCAGYAKGAAEAEARLPERVVSSGKWATERVVMPTVQVSLGLATKVDAKLGGHCSAFVEKVAAKLNEEKDASVSVEEPVTKQQPESQ